MIAVLGIFLFQALNNLIVISQDTTPFIGDASDLYKHSIYYFKLFSQAFQSLDIGQLSPLFHLILSGQLLGIAALPFYAIFGVSHDSAVSVNLLFLLILLASVYKIGEYLFGRTAGVLAAFIISLYPSVFGFSRIFMLEFAALGIAALCVFFLLASGGLRRRGWSLALGIAVGLGILLRPRFIVGILPALLFCLCFPFAPAGKEGQQVSGAGARKLAANLLFSCLLCYFVVLPWYSLANIKEYFSFQKIWSTFPSFAKAWATLPAYAAGLFTVHLGRFFSILFFGSSLLVFFKKQARTQTALLFFWLICGIFLISGFGIKGHLRLELFLCLPLALITAQWLQILLAARATKIIVHALLVAGIIQYFSIVYGKPSSDLVRHDQYFAISDRQGLLQAGSKDWGIDRILSVMRRQRNFDRNYSWKQVNANINYLLRLKINDDDFDKVIKVLYIEVRGSPIGNEIDERILTDGLGLSLLGLYPDDFDYRALFSSHELECMVRGADYVIVFRDTPAGRARSGFLERITAIFQENAGQFEEIKEIATPWGACVIYGKV